MSNKNIWEKKSVVEFYSKKNHLQKPEIAIYNILKDTLYRFRMLDIGVGGGRTSFHFKDAVKEYIGIDYSRPMIEACRKRFSNNGENCKFLEGDISKDNLTVYGKFDLILFSYNGIDYLDHDERIKTLYEIKKLLYKNGYFIFSSHNINFIKTLFSIRFSKTIKQNIFSLILRIINVFNKKQGNDDQMIINDGEESFQLKTYFISPIHQLDQLKTAGFKNIRIFCFNNGKEVTASDASKMEEPWFYYFCE